MNGIIFAISRELTSRTKKKKAFDAQRRFLTGKRKGGGPETRSEAEKGDGVLEKKKGAKEVLPARRGEEKKRASKRKKCWNATPSSGKRIGTVYVIERKGRGEKKRFAYTALPSTNGPKTGGRLHLFLDG